MGWPYHFVDLNAAEKQLRREALDRFALYAQLSALLPLVVVLLYRIVAWAFKSRHGAYSAVPSSPSLKSQRLTASGGWAAQVRRWKWWLGEDLNPSKSILGQRDGMFRSTGETATELLTFLTRVGSWYLLDLLVAGPQRRGHRRW